MHLHLYGHFFFVVACFHIAHSSSFDLLIAARGGEPPARRPADRDTHSDRDGSSHNNDRSPAHPYGNRPNARETGRGAASPAWDRRGRHPSGGDEGSVMAPGTPKTRLRPGARPEEPVRAIPSVYELHFSSGRYSVPMSC